MNPLTPHSRRAPRVLPQAPLWPYLTAAGLGLAICAVVAALHVGGMRVELVRATPAKTAVNAPIPVAPTATPAAEKNIPAAAATPAAAPVLTLAARRAVERAAAELLANLTAAFGAVDDAIIHNLSARLLAFAENLMRQGVSEVGILDALNHDEWRADVDANTLTPAETWAMQQRVGKAIRSLEDRYRDLGPADKAKALAQLKQAVEARFTEWACDWHRQGHGERAVCDFLAERRPAPMTADEAERLKQLGFNPAGDWRSQIEAYKRQRLEDELRRQAEDLRRLQEAERERQRREESRRR